ncbi:MAG: hypothetical protein IKI58_04005 [Oscillospiraceae bacterium]|nr:hypothetical protein [Oscillospiraceae bacterium]
MLKTLLSPDTCAECRNCCIFEEKSAWEVPAFPESAVRKLKDKPEYKIRKDGTKFRIELPYGETHSAQPCPFLNSQTGCTLSPEEKPFACSVWPIRIMTDSCGRPALTLYNGCPGITSDMIPELKKLLDSGLRERIFSELKRDPTLLLPYHPNYIFL